MKKTNEVDDALIREAYRIIDENGKKMAALRRQSERCLASVTDLIVGRRITSFYTGALAGDYQVTNVDLNYDGSEIRVHGLKITDKGAGKLGSQVRELGIFTLKRIGIKEEANG